MIPYELSSLNKLKYLYVFLKKNIRKFVNFLRYLDHNQFIGCLPKELSSLTNLIYLFISKNELYGTLPVEYTSLTNLRHL